MYIYRYIVVRLSTLNLPHLFLASFSPFVLFQVCGVPADQRTETTHVVEADGFHPRWDSTFTFPIQAPEHALVSLTVWDKDVGKVDDFIAAAVLPVSCLRPGFRKVQLGNISGSKGADHEFCSLFVFVLMDT
jgi:Ca2+-dependent lipid-binding protein